MKADTLQTLLLFAILGFLIGLMFEINYVEWQLHHAMGWTELDFWRWMKSLIIPN